MTSYVENMKVFYPLELGEKNAILRAVSVPVEKIDAEIQDFCEILLELMWGYDGVGLAAPQIGKNLRIIATTQWKKQPDENTIEKDFLGETVLINPELLDHSKEMMLSEEACLSLPGKKGFVERYSWVKVSYLNTKGQQITQKFSGFNAFVVQHEMDHIDGILFTDKLVKKK